VGFVGIIANPASGKDIRRVVSHATVVNNHEKVSIVRRVLLALHASGVRRVEIMPDHFGIGVRALDGLRNNPQVQAMTSLIDAPCYGAPFDGTPDDSLHAAQYLRDAGAGCIVVLGGDGTCRVVAKGLALGADCGPTSKESVLSASKELALSVSKELALSEPKEPALNASKEHEVPLLPLSTGTNNVVPFFIEGTVAGAAAAYVALHPPAERERCCYRHKRLLVHVNGERVDQALVEVGLLATGYVGARAVWSCDRLRQIFVSRAQPTNIGLSSVIGVVHPVPPLYPGGACATLSATGQQVMAPIAPGSLVQVGVGEVIDLEPSVPYPVQDERPAVLALDGEREIVLHDGDRATVTLDLDGPWIVDVERTLMRAVQAGAFLR
jgi:predicted polyphosphate/ATP-dependent NAD kinase